MFCDKCGNELNEGASFCPKCGNKIKVYSSMVVNDSSKLANSKGKKYKRGLVVGAIVGLLLVLVIIFATTHKQEIIKVGGVEFIVPEGYVQHEVSQKPIMADDVSCIASLQGDECNVSFLRAVNIAHYETNSERRAYIHYPMKDFENEQEFIMKNRKYDADVMYYEITSGNDRGKYFIYGDYSWITVIKLESESSSGDVSSECVSKVQKMITEAKIK